MIRQMCQDAPRTKNLSVVPRVLKVAKAKRMRVPSGLRSSIELENDPVYQERIASTSEEINR